MIWKKSKTLTNDNKDMPCWQDTQGIYFISPNINNGETEKGTIWIFEVSRKTGNKEVSVGVEETLKRAKALAETDAEKLAADNPQY